MPESVLPALLLLLKAPKPKAPKPPTDFFSWDWIEAQFRNARWSDWQGFWLEKIFDDRLLVIFSVPLLAILLWFSRRNLRIAIVVTGLLFVTAIFGALYAALWLITCLVFHAYGEWFARHQPVGSVPRCSGCGYLLEGNVSGVCPECGARDSAVVRRPLPIAAIVIFCGWYLASMAMGRIPLPDGANDWVRAHLPLLLPLGSRGLWWEPQFIKPPPTQILRAIFIDPHLIGTAYLLVKMLHYFSELRRGGIAPEMRSRLSFLAWVCYAPSFMQGPVERFPRFIEEIETSHLRRSLANVPYALWRIGLGISKSIISTILFVPVLWEGLGIGKDEAYYKHPETIGSYGLLYAGLFLKIFALYLEFSGYVDISAGIGRLLGYRQIENFNWPWAATSLRNFWRRWHISLSMILRDYVYIPFGGNRRHVFFNLVTTFAICGAWHRPIPQVIAWGAIMGTLLWINQRWAQWNEWLAEHPELFWSRVQRAWLRLQPLPQFVSWLITIHVFCWTLLCFFGGKAIIWVTIELLGRPLKWLFGVN